MEMQLKNRNLIESKVNKIRQLIREELFSVLKEETYNSVLDLLKKMNYTTNDIKAQEGSLTGTRILHKKDGSEIALKRHSQSEPWKIDAKKCKLKESLVNEDYRDKKTNLIILKNASKLTGKYADTAADAQRLLVGIKNKKIRTDDIDNVVEDFLERNNGDYPDSIIPYESEGGGGRETFGSGMNRYR